MRFINNGKKINAKKRLLPEGDYRAEIKNVKFNLKAVSAYGIGSNLEITYELQDKEGLISVKKIDSVWCSEAPNSRCMQFLNALYDGNPPEEMELEEWKDRRGWVKIEHDKDGNYANIVAWDFPDKDEPEDELDSDEDEDEENEDETEEEISFNEEDDA